MAINNHISHERWILRILFKPRGWALSFFSNKSFWLSAFECTAMFVLGVPGKLRWFRSISFALDFKHEDRNFARVFDGRKGKWEMGGFPPHTEQGSSDSHPRYQRTALGESLGFPFFSSYRFCFLRLTKTHLFHIHLGQPQRVLHFSVFITIPEQPVAFLMFSSNNVYT